MRLGILIDFNEKTDIKNEFEKAISLGFSNCQLCIWNSKLYTDENAKIIKYAQTKTKLEISALWAGWSGPRQWNFYGGPSTLGLVPTAYRNQRLVELMLAGDFAEKIGVKDVITHVGFLPENPNDPKFPGVVEALRYLGMSYKEKGLNFLFETGQETPVTLLRTIEAVGTENLGINFDMANLILYGKANPVDALDVFGKYVLNTHFKDGDYPICGTELGNEKPLGEGKVNLPLILKKLKELNYQGPFTIEREINGEQQIQDIIRAKELILKHWDAL